MSIIYHVHWSVGVGWTNKSWSTCLLFFSTSSRLHTKSTLSTATMKEEGYLPLEVYIRLIAKMLYWSIQTKHDHLDNHLSQNMVVMFYGCQKFRLGYLPALNSIVLEVEGECPIGILSRIKEQVKSVLDEAMKMLHVSVLVPYGEMYLC